jgi:uncharacterized protein YhbP (UPF0306 family)
VEGATAENGWIDTIYSKNPEILTRARGIVENNLYCVLSTCSSDGFPWVSPVFFACDEGWNIYWASAVASRHSQNLYSNNGRAAIAIFDSSVAAGTGKGVYFSGTASEASAGLAGKAFKLLAARTGKQPQTTAEDYLNSSPRRIYQFQPQEAWVSGERLAVGNNQLVDTKIQINLQDL